MNSSVFSHTPTVTVRDARGPTLRDIQYHRIPDSPGAPAARIARHQYNSRGFLTRSADPRLQAAGLANFSFQSDLAGKLLQTVSADAGISIAITDAAGRPVLACNANGTIHSWQYESASLPGRPLSITEQVPGQTSRITERFVYAGHLPAEQALNLAGHCVRHYDVAGRVQINGVSLTGAVMSTSTQILPDSVNADWQGTDETQWGMPLTGMVYVSMTTADASGNTLTFTDSTGNAQRMAWDVTGQLKATWLTLKDGTEQVIVKSVNYSAAGQVLQEVHANGVVTTYEYDPQTQRLMGMKTERPVGHTTGAKVLQDLRYEYDPVGNVVKVRNDAEATRFWRNQKVVPESTYVYDSLYQLVSASGREMANSGQSGSELLPATIQPVDSSSYTNYTRTYTYDDAGNLTQIRHSCPATRNSYTTSITVSSRSNRAVVGSLTVDLDHVEGLFMPGGQQKQLLPGLMLEWNGRGELAEVSPVIRPGLVADRESYRYNSYSQRVSKTTVQKCGDTVRTRKVIYQPGLERRSVMSGSSVTELLEVTTMRAGGRAQVQVLHWEGGRPSAISNDQMRYRYGDLTESTGLEVDQDGCVISQEEYYPYGGTAVLMARSQVEADYRVVRYSGKERDVTGLYYYGYRYYQSWAGRWLSADPAGVVDGLNLFRMCRNNPVTLRDDNGLAPIPQIVHYAWEGKNISTRALSNILSLNLVEPDHEINIWTLRPMSIYSTLDKMLHSENLSYERFLAYELGSTLNINSTKELYEILKSSHPNGKKLESLYNREINGAYRNYAAASDMTRAALMFEKGGVYMDVDVIIASSGELTEIMNHSVSDGFLYVRTEQGTSNAVLASTRHSEKSSKFIDSIVSNITELDEIRPLTSWTTKRSLISDDALTGRLKGTVNTSGPAVLNQLGGDRNNVISDASFFYFSERLATTRMKRFNETQSIQDVVHRGLTRGLDARGQWSKMRPERRDSI